MKKILAPLLATLLTLAMGGPAARAADVIETISSISNFSTFSRLLAQSGLVETIRSLKACTIYVPGNSAFGRLPAGVVDNLLKPEHKEELAKLIRYHIIPSRWTEGSMDGNDFRIATLGGQQLHIDADDPGGIKIDAAKIVSRDISAGNCVVHELNRVLAP